MTFADVTATEDVQSSFQELLSTCVIIKEQNTETGYLSSEQKEHIDLITDKLKSREEALRIALKKPDGKAKTKLIDEVFNGMKKDLAQCTPVVNGLMPRSSAKVLIRCYS